MQFQAFIDDSYSAGGTYILAGAVATSENWELFSKEWEILLNSGWGLINDKNNKHHFKYSEMKFRRKENIPVFLNTLEKYISCFIATKIDISDLEKAKKRIVIEGIQPDWTEFDAFYMAFRSLMDKFHMHRNIMIEALGSGTVDFYFDDQSQKGRIFKMWDNYLKNRPEDIRSYYGNLPRFESDSSFLPLQGADLLAGFARDCYEQNNSQAFITMSMEKYKRTSNHRILGFLAEETEDDLTKYLIRQARHQVPASAVICDFGAGLKRN